MLQQGGCAQGREKPHSPHGQGQPPAAAPDHVGALQHIPITEHRTQQPSFKGFNHKDQLSWKSFSPVHFTWEAEWPEDGHMDHDHS